MAVVRGLGRGRIVARRREGGGADHGPVDKAEQCACAELADWEQVWVKESGPVSAPHQEGDTAHGLESVGGLADTASLALYYLSKTRNSARKHSKNVVRKYYLDKTSLLLALRGPLPPSRPPSFKTPKERPPKENLT